MDAPIAAAQVLYGYRDGHRLLQSSRIFVGVAERALLTLSDMSGPRMVSGFEEYITAYPVPGEGSYAITKTWYASEMQRPGCVWTHGLIFATSELSTLRSLTDILPYFRRPIDQVVQGYDAPLLVKPQPTDENDLRLHPEDAAALLACLYGVPKSAILVPASDSKTYEQLACAAWSQQWPALRSSFRFCTGSLAGRTLGSLPFDLQVVPQRIARELQRDAETFTILKSVTTEAPSDVRQWLSTAVADLLDPDRDGFREYLWKFGDDSQPGRLLFSQMAQLFKGLREARNGTCSRSEVMAQICHIFPDKRSGVALKVGLYGPESPNRTLLVLSEYDRLYELAHSPHSSAFDASLLNLRARASILWRSSREHALRLLLAIVSGVQSELSEEILAGLAQAVSASDLTAVVSRRPGVLPVLAVHNSALVVESEFWACSAPTQVYLDVLDTLQSPTLDLVPEDWVPAVLEAGLDTIAAAVVERYGRAATHASLNYYNTSRVESIDVPNSWRAALATRQSDIVSWLEAVGGQCQRGMLALSAALLDPRSPEVSRLGLKPWLQLANSPAQIQREPGAAAAAFLLSIALGTSNADATGLIAATFDAVYSAAAHDRLRYESWQFLKERAPVTRWGREWDKCERLRQAVVRHFAKCHWPEAKFLECIHDSETFRKVLTSGRETREGEEFLRAVAKAVVHGSLPASMSQKSALTEAFFRNWWDRVTEDLL
jgi:hypothetical protein